MEMLPPDQEPLPTQEAGGAKGLPGRLDRWVVFLTRILFWVAGAGLIGMLLLIVADVIGIKVFSHPVPGGIEIVAFLAVVAIAFAVAHTQVMRGHVAVDFIVGRFPRRVKLVVDALMFVLSVCLFALMAYYSFKYAHKLRVTGEVSMTKKIPYYPFVYAMACCFVVTLVVLIADLVKSIAKAVTTWTR
ncbi:MAG: TRAP transporter small permease [Actinobacteria bacterium]|jgi:TRAP-type C4-dicarboxylate transport system permease small subunit|nr:TRAP transporter small permease [Actinomycetota bacterium]